MTFNRFDCSLEKLFFVAGNKSDAAAAMLHLTYCLVSEREREREGEEEATGVGGREAAIRIHLNPQVARM